MRQNKGIFLENSVFTIVFVRWFLLLLTVTLFQFGLLYPALLIFLVLAITELGKWWSRYSLERLGIEVSLAHDRVFAGESTVFQVVLHNHKFFPAMINFTQPLEITDGLVADEIQENQWTFGTILPWFSTVSSSFTLGTQRRGYFELPAATITGSDGMGYYSYEKTLAISQRLVVYPRVYDLAELGIKASDLIGEKPDRRYILPDPIQVAGLRPYTPDMPARRIDWRASAHQDILMARIIEPSADHKLFLVMDVQEYTNDSRAEYFEPAISILASLAIWADRMSIPFGALVNGVRKKLPGPLSMPIAGGFDHLSTFMENLARLCHDPVGPIDELLHAEASHLPWGSTLLVIGERRLISLAAGMSRIIYLPPTGLLFDKMNQNEVGL